MIVFILNKFGHIGNKISYEINNFDSKFDMNYMSFHRYQMTILITDIQHLSGKLSHWAGTCINVKILDSLIQITSRISKVLQSPHHRALFKDDKKNNFKHFIVKQRTSTHTNGASFSIKVKSKVEFKNYPLNM